MNLDQWIATAIPTGAVVLSMLTNGWQISQVNKRIDDLRQDFSHRFDDVNRHTDEGFNGIRRELDTMNVRLSRVEARLDRIDTPIVKP